jgi:hypothetical protein
LDHTRYGLNVGLNLVLLLLRKLSNRHCRNVNGGLRGFFDSDYACTAVDVLNDFLSYIDMERCVLVPPLIDNVELVCALDRAFNYLLTFVSIFVLLTGGIDKSERVVTGVGIPIPGLRVLPSALGKNDPLVLTRMEPLDPRSDLPAKTGKLTQVNIIRAGGGLPDANASGAFFVSSLWLFLASAEGPSASHSQATGQRS